MFLLKKNFFFYKNAFYVFNYIYIYILYLQEKNEGIFDEGLDLSFN